MKNRDLRFDKLKLCSMMGIVYIHCIGHGNILEKINYLSTEYFFIVGMYTVCFSMTNVFVIASSHLLINKYKSRQPSIRYEKILKIVLLTTAYSTFIYLILVVIGEIEFSLFSFLKSLFSVGVNQYWFVGAYIFLYAISPFLYEALDLFEKKVLLNLCVLSLIFFSIFPSVFIFSSVLDFYDAQHGKSIIWMIVLFMCTFYINKYGQNDINKIPKKIAVSMIAGATLFLVLSRVVLRYVSYLIGLAGDGEGRLYFDESIFIVIISFGIFILVIGSKKTKALTKFDHMITICSETTLGIYLIHNHPDLRRILWFNGNNIIFSNPGTEVPMLLVVVILVFATCMGCELCRISIVKALRKTRKRG